LARAKCPTPLYLRTPHSPEDEDDDDDDDELTRQWSVYCVETDQRRRSCGGPGILTPSRSGTGGPNVHGPDPHF